jgi:transposase-like protein
MRIEVDKSMEKNEIIETDEEPLLETPEPKEKTRLEQFVEKLRVYSTQEEAKTHIQEIATEIGCAKSLGYKAIKKILKEGGFSGQPAPRTEAKEPTAKVEDVQPEPLEETQETEFEETAETAAEPEGIAQPAAAAMELLDPKRLKRTLDIVFNKIAKMTKYPDFALEENESTALAETWQPVLVQYAPSLITNPLAWAGITTLVVFAPKILGYIAERQKKKEDKPLPEPKKQEPPPETPKEPPKEETPPPLENDGIVNATKKEKPQTAAFMKSL